MRGQTKRDIHDVVSKSVRLALREHGFRRERQGYWWADRDEVRWEFEVVLEPAHGDNNFRLEWGVRAPGLTSILEQEEIEHAQDCALGGDLASLAQGRSGMTFLVLGAPRAGLLWRLMASEVRFATTEDAVATITKWLRGPLLGILRPLVSFEALASFAERPHKRGEILYPESRVGLDETSAALWALAGNREAALAALGRFRAGIPKTLSAEINKERAAYCDRLAKNIEELTQ